MNTVSVVLPDGTVRDYCTPLDPGFAVVVLVGGRWAIRCYTATRRHAVWLAEREPARSRGWVTEAAVVATTVTRPQRHRPARPGLPLPV